jgi:hypothetical protein
MTGTLQVELLAAAVVALGLAMLIEHALTVRILALIGTVLAGAVLIILAAS